MGFSKIGNDIATIQWLLKNGYDEKDPVGYPGSASNVLRVFEKEYIGKDDGWYQYSISVYFWADEFYGFDYRIHSYPQHNGKWIEFNLGGGFTPETIEMIAKSIYWDFRNGQYANNVNIEEDKKTAWDDAEKGYEEACDMESEPDGSFPCPEHGAVIDADKTADWNMKEVSRLRSKYLKERKRLWEIQRQKLLEAINGVIDLIASEGDMTHEQAKHVWNFLGARRHTGFRAIREYIAMVKRVPEAKQE